MDPHTWPCKSRDDQHEHTFSNYVRIWDVVQKTCLRRWTIGKSGERGSGISVLPARHDDDDEYTVYKEKALSLRVLEEDIPFLTSKNWGVSPHHQGCPRGVMVKAMNCGIVVCGFVLQSRYYVHFRANTLGKGMNPLILPPAMGK